jgi:hypothetical protein
VEEVVNKVVSKSRLVKQLVKMNRNGVVCDIPHKVNAQEQLNNPHKINFAVPSQKATEKQFHDRIFREIYKDINLETKCERRG